jgi:uncharacterized protein involved in type VI secretion and phage assembly
MSKDLLNMMRREALKVSGQQSLVRMGIVSSYDADHYAAKVRIQPEGHETGWLPVATPWVGNGWGLFAPPTEGDVVDVHFQEGGREAAFVSLRFFGDEAPPLSVPSGEFWLVHKSGSFVKFHNDGSVELSAASTLRLEAPVIQLHATTEFRFDVNGHGQAWHTDRINTYQIGEVSGTAHPISPPEIGD